MFWLASLVPLGRAHVEDLVGGIDILDDVGPTTIEANFGLLIEDGDGFAWVCHEAVTEPKALRTPRYRRNTDGTWLAVVSNLVEGRGGRTLFRSIDGGCSWDDVAGVDGVLMAAAAFDPSDPTRAWGISANPGGDNPLWTSTDGGATWGPEAAAVPGRVFYDLEVHDDGVWATATDLGGTRGYLWRRSPAQTTPPIEVWTEVEVGLPANTEGAKLHILGRDGSVLWLAVDPIGDDTLIRSTDGGDTFATVAQGGEMIDGAPDGDGIWLLRDGLELSWTDADGPRAPLPAFPPAIGVTLVDGALTVAEQSYISGPLLSVSPDGGETFPPVAYPDDVHRPLDCPAGTDQVDVCDPLWKTLLPRIRGFDAPPIETADTGSPAVVDPPVEDTSPSCGCGGGGSVASLFLVGLGLGIRRRRGNRP